MHLEIEKILFYYSDQNCKIIKKGIEEENEENYEILLKSTKQDLDK